MEDPEYRAAYEQSAREIAQTDAVIRALDALRIDLGISKAELARRVNRNASSVRRLFTASQVRPELPLIAALADALGAEPRLVPRTPDARRAMREHHHCWRPTESARWRPRRRLPGHHRALPDSLVDAPPSCSDRRIPAAKSQANITSVDIQIVRL
jgi:transcriptional regulator with XRE-family HTH domain